ncbi:MAG: hypothetical protein WB341_15230 [Terracidiphilus sp.]
MATPNPESPDVRAIDARIPSNNFLRDVIAEDAHTRKFRDAQIQTRFPPEHNSHRHARARSSKSRKWRQLLLSPSKPYD